MKHGIADIVHLVMAASLLAACERITDPALPSDAVTFNPPPEYTRWWAMTESCSGRSGSLASITWDYVPGATLELNGGIVTSYWTSGSNSIVLAEGVRLDGSVVRHEMLHALTKTPGHSRADFLDRCGGVVSCSTACVADAGAAPGVDFTIPVVPVDSLEVNVSLVPSMPSLAIDSGSFTMILSIHNPASHAVVTTVPEVINGVSVVYQYAITSPFVLSNQLDGGRYIEDRSVNVFAPDETKHQYFDFFVGSFTGQHTLIPGVYDVAGSYGHKSAVLPRITMASN